MKQSRWRIVVDVVGLCSGEETRAKGDTKRVCDFVSFDGKGRVLVNQWRFGEEGERFVVKK